MGMHGVRAVNSPFGVEPKPIEAVSHRLASVQLRESIPWLYILAQVRAVMYWPSLLEEFSQSTRLACPTGLLPVDVVHGLIPKIRYSVSFRSQRNCYTSLTSICQKQNSDTPMMEPKLA